ncbi:MAG: radical SAM protein [candidate division NC10 bacterium]|nr:radical SAM protein [candidate division NC10 bacterium]
MNILLISPDLQGSIFRYSRREVRSFSFPRLTLPLLAALTPPEHSVRLIDESVEDIDFDAQVDLVGISLLTFLAPRGYEVADRFRARGIPVVLGGMHASALPEEALLHADSVVIGEAEEIWPSLLKDLQRGELKRIYRNQRRPRLEGLPRPRLDLLRREGYLNANCVQATRGCPFGCDFCSVTDFFGNSYRLRPVKEVVAEVAALPGDFIFVDDNIAGNRAYARELFSALIPLGKKWGSQCTLSLAEDPELLALAAESGCTHMFVGIESILQANLKGVGKSFNRVAKYEDLIGRFHDQGIVINAGMIFGMDEDDDSVFPTTVEFLEKNRIELTLFNILTPLPGTRLYARLEEEGRIIDRDWSHYDGRHVVFRPQRMAAETLRDGFFWAFHRLYSWRSMLTRLPRSRARKIPLYYVNFAYRRILKRIPKGGLSPLCMVLRKGQGRIPLREKAPLLIPNALEAIKHRAEEIGGRLDAFLQVKMQKMEWPSDLQISLEGVLDKAGAKVLRKKIEEVVKKIKTDKIVIDFEKLRYATPQGIQALFAQKSRAQGRRAAWKAKLIHVGPALREILAQIDAASHHFEFAD